MKNKPRSWAASLILKKTTHDEIMRPHCLGVQSKVSHVEPDVSYSYLGFYSWQHQLPMYQYQPLPCCLARCLAT